MRLCILDEFFGNNFLIDRPPDFLSYVASHFVSLAPRNDCSDMHFEYRCGPCHCVPFFYIFDYSESESSAVRYEGRIADFYLYFKENIYTREGTSARRGRHSLSVPFIS